MKKTVYFFAILLSVFLSFTSCSKESEEEVDNYLQVDGGTHYKITQATVMGFIAQNGEEENYYLISLVAQEGSTTRIVQLAIFFPYNQSINGTYTIPESSRYLNSWLSNYSITENSNIQSFNDLSEGTCAVDKVSSNNFKITFSIKPNNNQVITGQFSGTVILQEQ